MSSSLSIVARALVVAAGIAIAPGLAFAQATPAQPAKPAAATEAKPSNASMQTGEAACAVHKKDSKELKDCMLKTKAAHATTSKDAVKKTH